ncbi:hypothetical protein ABIB40_003676 [Pedobacter sp. UYP30]|uniref:hypothetical protein n=1 Tax=Pedobacter sp. UYP30 TaxID=1756400 RepID=UPI00339A4A0E
MATGTFMGIIVKCTKLSLLTFLLMMVGCKQQVNEGKTISKKKSNYIEKNKMEKFDVGKFAAEMLKDEGYSGYYLKDGTYVQEGYMPKPNASSQPFDTSAVLTYDQQIITPDNYTKINEFYASGQLKKSLLMFSVDLETGLWKYYDEQGNLTESIDKDKGYKFTLENVIDFGKAKNIDFYKEGDVNRGFDEKFKKNVWAVSWFERKINEDAVNQIYLLDGDSGAELNHITKPAPVMR